MDLHSTLEFLSRHPDYTDLRSIPGIRIDLKYASTDNFMRKNVYGDFTHAFLHRLAADKLRDASARLQGLRPGWSIIVFDALRPRSVQRQLWAHVVNTPQQAYVANPDRGGMHNFGCAIDLSLLDEGSKEVDMGTPFDTFDPLSEPQLEQSFLAEGRLTKPQVENRGILRSIMADAGFHPLPHEWWHFDAFPAAQVRSEFTIIE